MSRTYLSCPNLVGHNYSLNPKSFQDFIGLPCAPVTSKKPNSKIFGRRLLDNLYTCPSHFSLLHLTISTMCFVAHLSRIVSLRTLSLSLTPQMVLRHPIWNTFNLWRSASATAQTSQPYNNVDWTCHCTMTLYKMDLRPFLMKASFQICNFCNLSKA
jgi:hypothetical protein